MKRTRSGCGVMVDALDLESSENFMRVQVSPSVCQEIKKILSYFFFFLTRIIQVNDSVNQFKAGPNSV